MTISELIRHLEQVRNCEGDLNVYVQDADSTFLLPLVAKQKRRRRYLQTVDDADHGRCVVLRGFYDDVMS